MRYGNYDKIKKIRKTEKELEKLLDGIKMFCSNNECINTVVLKPEEATRVIMCGKCHKGFFAKEKPLSTNKINVSNKNKQNKRKEKRAK